MSEPAYCSYAGAKCQFNNAQDCPKQSVLKHCDVLKESSRRAKDDQEMCGTVRGKL